MLFFIRFVSLHVATTEEKEDDPIEDYVKSMGIRCFRGSAENVLDRFFHAAVFYHAEIIVRSFIIPIPFNCFPYDSFACCVIRTFSKKV